MLTCRPFPQNLLTSCMRIFVINLDCRKMSTSYTLQCKNSIDIPLYFVVYQAYPRHQLESVAWQVQGVPENGNEPIPWSMDYGIALTEYNQVLQQYTTIKTVDTPLGNMYAVTEVAGVPNISGNVVGGAGSPEQMALQNETTTPVNTGFTLGEKLIGAERNVGGQGISIYDTSNTYTVTCYSTEVKEGEVMNLPGRAVLFILPEITFSFPDSVSEGTVEALVQNGVYHLQFTTQPLLDNVNAPIASGSAENAAVTISKSRSTSRHKCSVI